MTSTILIVFGIVVIVLLLSRRGREQVAGIYAAAIGLDAKKRENKEKVLEFLGKRRQGTASGPNRPGSYISAKTINPPGGWRVLARDSSKPY